MFLNTHISTYFDAQLFSLKGIDAFSPLYYQFIMVLNGEISVENGKELMHLSSEDFIMLVPDQTYTLIPSSENYLLSIEVSRSFILPKINNEMSLRCNSFISDIGSDQIRSILRKLMIAFHAHDAIRNNLSNIYSNLFVLVNCLRTYYMFYDTSTSNSQDQKYKQRKSEITNYLYRNYQLSITVQNLADSMYLSPQYLAKFIKQHFGQTFFKLLTSIRLENALVELTHTEHSLTMLAFNNGFPNLNAFNKVFKEFFNTTPSIYRQNERISRDEIQQKKSSIIAPMNYQKAKDLLNKGDYSNSDSAPLQTHTVAKVVRTDIPTTPLNKIWRELINLGSAKNALSESIQSMFQSSQKELHFKYARIENIFDDDIIYQLPNTDIYNFTSLDTIIDFLIENDTIPHLELGVKPDKTNILTSSNGSFIQEYINEKTETYYFEAFEALLKHYINRYGVICVSSWRFELWARHENALVYKESPSKYIKRFKTFRDMLNNYVPKSQLGGPGFNTTSSSTFFNDLIQEFEKRKVYPDFISLSLFSYEISSTDKDDELQNAFPSVILTPSQDRFVRIIRSYRQTIDATIGKQIPIIVTQFNSDITTNNYILYSCFQSAFICKNNIELFDLVESLGYYIFSSQNGLFMTKHQNTDIGLIGIHDIKNPSYYSYELLNKLGNKLVAKSENYIITTDSNERFQILAFNYAHFNPSLCINFYDHIDIEHTYDIFEKIAPLSIDISLIPVQAGRYKVVTHILNRQFGSFIDQYIQQIEERRISSSELLNIIVNLQADEATYYKNICIPKQLISYVECDNELPLHITLEPHQITYMEITRKI